MGCDTVQGGQGRKETDGSVPNSLECHRFAHKHEGKWDKMPIIRIFQRRPTARCGDRRVMMSLVNDFATHQPDWVVPENHSAVLEHPKTRRSIQEAAQLLQRISHHTCEQNLHPLGSTSPDPLHPGHLARQPRASFTMSWSIIWAYIIGSLVYHGQLSNVTWWVATVC
jgi:hypothetical protein